MSFNAAADTGSFFNMKDHQSWISGLFRIKISFDEPFTLTFRLRGFTSAFNRAITLMTPDEEKYF